MSLIPNPLPQHAKPQDRDSMIDWARSLLNKRDFVVLDTETTGFSAADEVVQIGIVGPDGKVLMDNLIKPETHKQMPKKAQEVHGITMKMLKNAPRFAEILPELLNAISDRLVICFNSSFDMRLLDQSAQLCQAGAALNLRNDCAMLAYSQFIGLPNRYANGYAWQRLPRPTQEDHKAIDDCHLTLELIRNMADVSKQEEALDFSVASIALQDQPLVARPAASAILR